jgi:hypothetical protein
MCIRDPYATNRGVLGCPFSTCFFFTPAAVSAVASACHPVMFCIGTPHPRVSRVDFSTKEPNLIVALENNHKSLDMKWVLIHISCLYYSLHFGIFHSTPLTLCEAEPIHLGQEQLSNKSKNSKAFRCEMGKWGEKNNSNGF